MIGQPHGAVQHARHRHVVDELAVAEHGVVARVARQIGADATGLVIRAEGSRHGSPRRNLAYMFDAVDDLRVARAAAQMRLQ